MTSPSIGIVAGGVLGPAVGLLVPTRAAHETAPIGTAASADRYAMPGPHVDLGTEDDDAAHGIHPTDTTDGNGAAR